MRGKWVLPREPGRERTVCAALGLRGEETKAGCEKEQVGGFDEGEKPSDVRRRKPYSHLGFQPLIYSQIR